MVSNGNDFWFFFQASDLSSPAFPADSYFPADIKKAEEEVDQLLPMMPPISNKQMEDDHRLIVNLESIEVAPNLDEVSICK